jgi:hypothetical protein
MTADRSMNVIIHGAFRRDMARFDRALADFPAGSTERGDELHRAWAFFSRELHDHHDSEEAIFFPALQQLGVGEPLMQDMHGEHAEMVAALDAATARMDELAAQPSAENAAAAHAGVVALRDRFESHVAHEEREFEPVLLEQENSAPLKLAAKRFRRQQGPIRAGQFLAWVQDDATPENRAALADIIPRPVLFVFGHVVGRRYHRDIAPVWAA